MDYSETPVIDLKSQFLDNWGVRVLVKREDLNHPHVSGNKWWKLKYNLEEAMQKGHQTLLTFGGAFSNHIYAVAAAAKSARLESIGIIRGEERMNATMVFAKSQGMQLHFISREDYRRKTEPEFIDDLRKRFGDFFLIPEGGTNQNAIRGCEELGVKLNGINADVVCLAVGTGGTIAGLIRGLREKKVVGYSTLRGGDFLRGEIRSFPDQAAYSQMEDLHIETQYHFGGYGKTLPELDSFIRSFEKEYEIPLEHVYSGKVMFGVFDRIRMGTFARGSTILVLHTGGLQGKALVKPVEEKQC